MPLPKGVVRVYRRDREDALQFVGENTFDRTPKDEKVRLVPGDASPAGFPVKWEPAMR